MGAEDDNWLFCIAERDALAALVEARFAAGPFVRVDAAAPAPARRIEIADNIVREIGPHLDREFLARDLAVRTREPVVLQLGDHGGSVYAIDDPPIARRPDVPHRPLPVPWEPEIVLAFELDRERQRERSLEFERDIDGWVGKLFPIQNRQKTARLDCKKCNAYGPDQHVGPGTYRYDRRVEVELQLALFAWSADGNDRELIELRSESLTFWRYALLTPNHGIIHRGEERFVPMDEFAAGHELALLRAARAIKERMTESTTWNGVTPRQLVDP